MNVCIDVGNTTICVGFYKNDKLCKRLSQYTDASKTEDEYVLFLENALTSLKINKEEIERIDNIESISFDSKQKIAEQMIIVVILAVLKCRARCNWCRTQNLSDPRFPVRLTNRFHTSKNEFFHRYIAQIAQTKDRI